jgi:hypothetical protein
MTTTAVAQTTTNIPRARFTPCCRTLVAEGIARRASWCSAGDKPTPPQRTYNVIAVVGQPRYAAAGGFSIRPSGGRLVSIESRQNHIVDTATIAPIAGAI